MKQQLKGKQFKDVEDARAFFEGVISDMSQSTWSDAMVTWFEGTTKRLHVEGVYYEEKNRSHVSSGGSNNSFLS